MTPVTKVVNPLTHTPPHSPSRSGCLLNDQTRRTAAIGGVLRRSGASVPAVWTSHSQRGARWCGFNKTADRIHIRPNRQTPPGLGGPSRAGHAHHPQRKPAARTEGTKPGPPSKPLQQPRRYRLATYKNRRLESNTTNTTRSPRRRSVSQPAQPNQPQKRRFVIW